MKTSRVVIPDEFPAVGKVVIQSDEALPVRDVVDLSLLLARKGVPTTKTFGPHPDFEITYTYIPKNGSRVFTWRKK